MKRIVPLLTTVLLGTGAVLSCHATAETPLKGYVYTIQDVQNLQNFLLTKPVGETLSGKPYDLNGDGVWNVSDLCLMKRNYLETQEEAEMKMYIEVNGSTLTATLADSTAAQALAELLMDAPMELHLNEYGSFEKVGALSQSLPRNDERITTEPGDIMLYLGDQMTIFYGTNTWSYTRLGKIDNVTQAELKEILGNGSVTVTLSLADKEKYAELK